MNRLIVKFLRDGNITLDKNLIEKLKEILKDNPAQVKNTYKLIWKQFQEKHAQIRYSCLLLMEYLFLKSVLFRNLLLQDAVEFVALVSEILFPKTVKLKEFAKRVVGNWIEKFQNLYPQLLDPIQENRLKRYLTAIHEFEKLRSSLAELFKEIEACFELLVPSFDSIVQNSEQESSKSESRDFLESLKSYGLGNQDYTLDITVKTSVEKTADNEAIFDALFEKVALLKKKYLPKILLLLELSSITIDTDKNRQQTLLKEMIDLKNAINSISKKAEELVHDSEFEDEEFEDVEPVQDIPMPEAKTKKVNRKPILIVAEPFVTGLKPVFSSNSVSQPTDSTNDEKDTIPELPIGQELLWTRDQVSFQELSLHSGIEYHHRFLGELDVEKSISEETLNKMRQVQRYVEPIKPDFIPACNAPLKNGLLCQRRDLKKCPFHGEIVDRDEYGNILHRNEEDQEEEKKGKKEEATWMSIEDQVNQQYGLGDTPSNLLEHPKAKEKRRHRYRIQKKLSKSKGSQLADHQNLMLRDRMAFRW